MRNKLLFAIFLTGLFLFVKPLTAKAACALQTSTTSITLSSGDVCAISGVVGIDNGGSTNAALLTLPATTSLTINNGATLVLGSISLGGGTIIVSGTGQMKIGANLYATDADGDNYPASTTYSAASGANLVRLNTLSSLSSIDCYDSGTHAADAHPGQTGYFTVDRGDGSFDYNCVSGEEKNVSGTYDTCSTSICTYSTIIEASCSPNSYPACGVAYTAKSMKGGYDQNTCYTAVKSDIVNSSSGTVGCH